MTKPGDIDPDVLAALRTISEARRSKTVGEVRKRQSERDQAKFETQIELLVDEVEKVCDPNFGKSEDTFKVKSKGMWEEFQREAKEGATALDLVKQSGVQAFDDLSKNIQGAFSQVVLGEGNVAQALERATASSLASIASQAAVKAIFYTAEGFAALAGFNAGSAANYFTAAGEMAAVAGIAGVAGRALSSAAGSGGPGSQNTGGQSLVTGGSNTSGSGQRGGTSVHAFADGGIISAPTLALMGEAGREAVIPLDDPQARQQLGDLGGTHHHLHINVHGMISPDNLHKVINQINDRVTRGQSTLKATNSLRVTKRSA